MSDYAKLTLPATGSTGFAALALGDQLAVLVAIFVGAFAAAVLLRSLWRRGKNINQA
jgi:energy-converting hydrogenase Eha subunit E